MYRMNDYMVRLLKLPQSRFRDDVNREAELCERFEVYIADQLNDQRAGARVLSGWLSKHRRQVAGRRPSDRGPFETSVRVPVRVPARASQGIVPAINTGDAGPSGSGVPNNNTGDAVPTGVPENNTDPGVIPTTAQI